MPGDTDPASVVALLGSVPLFSSLSKRQLRTIADSGKERTFHAGDTIVKTADTGIGFYLLLEGQAHVVRAGSVVATLAPRQFFGEMALFDEQPRTADVRAATNVRCLILSPWEFWSSVGKEPEALRVLLKETVRRLRSASPGLTE